jgi:type VI secretion system secreted protein VgrG
MGLNIDAAAAFLSANAAPKSRGLCARYVRQALEAGGLRLAGHPAMAKDYRTTLLAAGFTVVCDSPSRFANGYLPMKGDVSVIQPYPGGSAAGHIAMYDGVQWISDFRQRDMWGGPGYRTNKPPIAILRPDGVL